MEQSLIPSETEIVDLFPKKSKQNLYLTEKYELLNHVRFCLTCYLTVALSLSEMCLVRQPQISLGSSLMMGTIIFCVTGDFRMQLTFTLLFTCFWSSQGVHELLPTPLPSIFCLQFLRIKSEE